MSFCIITFHEDKLLTVVTGCREFLVESAKKVGVEGAAEFLEDPNNGLKEVFSILIQSSYACQLLRKHRRNLKLTFL